MLSQHASCGSRVLWFSLHRVDETPAAVAARVSSTLWSEGPLACPDLSGLNGQAQIRLGRAVVRPAGRRCDGAAALQKPDGLARAPGWTKSLSAGGRLTPAGRYG